MHINTTRPAVHWQHHRALLPFHMSTRTRTRSWNAFATHRPRIWPVRLAPQTIRAQPPTWRRPSKPGARTSCVLGSGLRACVLRVRTPNAPLASVDMSLERPQVAEPGPTCRRTMRSRHTRSQITPPHHRAPEGATHPTPETEQARNHRAQCLLGFTAANPAHLHQRDRATLSSPTRCPDRWSPLGELCAPAARQPHPMKKTAPPRWQVESERHKCKQAKR